MNRTIVKARSVSLIGSFLIVTGSCNSEENKSDVEIILLGERHGVAEQQIEIAVKLDALSNSEQKTAVVMEMINEDQFDLVQAFKRLSPEKPTDFNYAIGWDKTNWPDYKYYEPIINVIWTHNLDLYSGDPSTADVARWRRGSFIASDANPKDILTENYGSTIAESVEASWMKVQQAAHCSLLEEKELKNVARLQMTRDLYMSQKLQSLKEKGYDLVVLIAGRSHIRKDRGVPMYLDANTKVETIAIIETNPQKNSLEDYQPEPVVQGILPYDQIILSDPLEERESDCERLRRKGLIK